MTATAPARTYTWSDGRERANDFRGSDLQQAISAYFGERNADELRRLQVENEKLRDLLALQKAKGAESYLWAT